MPLTAFLASVTLGGASSLVHAHGLLDGPLTQRFPAILTAGLLIAAWLAYLAGSRRIAPRAGPAWLFHAAGTFALLALLGPFDVWAKGGTSLHMVQHMVLIVVIAPLWALSRPLPQWRAVLDARLRWLWRWPPNAARFPLTMAAMHGAAIWFWHAPRPYMLALEDPWWHAVAHASLLLSAGLFWWAVLCASPQKRARAMLALLVTLMHTGLLGALLTFARTPLYGDATDLADQQLAGLIMWVPGGLIYLVAAAYSAHAWMRRLRRGSTHA